MNNYSVKLISITPDAENVISYCARVSSPQNQEKYDTAAKLLKYCLREKHWSIFEQAYLTVEVETSRDIAMQMIRHKSLNFQMHSARYAEAIGFCTYKARRQDKKNRQNSLDDMSLEDQAWFFQAQKQIQTLAEDLYRTALDKSIAKEQARYLLPGSAKTRLYVSGPIRSFLTYCLVRCEKATQKEHRDIAWDIWNILEEQVPTVAQAMEENYPEVFKL